MAEGTASVKRLLDPSDWRERQLENLRRVGEDNYGTGIKSPKKDPIAAGIDAEERYAERVSEAIDEERRKKALQATDMAEWFSYASELGAGRLVPGVRTREAEVKKFVDAWQPILTDHVSKVDAMAAVTDKDMEDRMLENLRGLKELKGSWR